MSTLGWCDSSISLSDTDDTLSEKDKYDDSYKPVLENRMDGIQLGALHIS